MIDIAIAQLLSQRGRIPAAQVTPSTEVRPTTQTLPRIAYTEIVSLRTYTDDGLLGLRSATYQLDIFGRSLADAKTVRFSVTARSDLSGDDAAKQGLDGYRGTVDQTDIRRIYFGNERVEPASQGAINPGQNQAIARCIVDLTVIYRELLVQPNFTV